MGIEATNIEENYKKNTNEPGNCKGMEKESELDTTEAKRENARDGLIIILLQLDNG